MHDTTVGGCNLTVPGRDCFFEHFAPGPLPLIPLKESALALVGRVSKVQPYLSADRTHIYTETTIQIEEVFKSPEGFSPPDLTLITDQIGGAMKMPSGRVIRDGSRIDFPGQANAGGRYVFFLRQVHEGKDLAILSAYELRDGKVFKLTEDGSPGNVLLSTTPNKADSLSDEQDFLQTIRQRDTLDPKTGNLHLTIPLAASTKPKDGWPSLPPGTTAKRVPHPSRFLRRVGARMTAPRGLRHQTSLHRIAVHSASVEAVVEKETGVRHFSRFLRSGLQNRRHRSGFRRLQPLQIFYGTNLLRP